MDKYSLFKQLIPFISSVHQISHDMAKDVKSDHITPVQYKIMEYLAVSPPALLSDISDCMKMSMPNTSRELKKLTEQQLVHKVVDENDRRKYYIHLTEQGTKMMDEAFAQIYVEFSARIADLSDADLEAVENSLHTLHSKVFYTQT
ncbi:MarR family winged helix-turn-helix transcriptional regulator [Paenibacillus endoradicis]|uniref:MarR family winged helix-turn-helix transcriptional regulator n=1 Tax=Paenibacillus endoradicis TaxID=2972487 RepID=UPI002159859C|nr:MarR family transcriptional regulator [Paenibacillus endoradicis]MCR8658865.1 MarR family transcriptional regulator [Paenibacillus endoradicis]